MEDGQSVPPSLGLATAINIQPTSKGKAITTGDLVLVASEVDPMLRSLRASDIEVTALHNHLASEQPRLFIMHFGAMDRRRGSTQGCQPHWTRPYSFAIGG